MSDLKLCDNTKAIVGQWRGGDLRQLAYILATTYHETAATMLPIRERGGDKYFFRMYDPKSYVPSRAALATKMGARPGDGVIFYGRGYVQLTWRLNYERFGKLLGQDFTSCSEAADKVMQPDNAAKIMFVGMDKGLFTGKKLSDYFNQAKTDWFNARRIINGTDCAEKIASIAKEYYDLLCDPHPLGSSCRSSAYGVLRREISLKD
jgi:putative chitinase